MAKELDVPVFALSQLSRKVEDRQSKRPQMSDLRESGCLHGDTKIYSPSLKKNILIKDLDNCESFTIVATDSTINNEIKAKKCFSTGEKEVFKITLINGQSISATSNHKFLTPNGWKEVDSLNNESIAIPLGIETKMCDIKDSEVSILGHFISNGCCLKSHAITVTINQEDSDLADKIMSDAKDCTDNKVEPRVVVTNTAKSKFSTVFFRPTIHLAPGKTNPIGDIMKKYGLFNKRTKEKFIPDELFFLPKRQICLFIKALFSGDGTVYYQEKEGRRSLKISYSSASDELINGLQGLLLHVGIVSFVTGSSNKKGQSWKNLYIAGKLNIELFVNNIGFINKRKNDVMINGWNKSKDNLAGWNKYEYNKNRTLCFMPIKSIESIGVHKVYDIEVPKLHNFVANGIITHNSIEQDADLVILTYRPAQYGILEDENGNSTVGRGILILAKNKEGDTGDIDFGHNKSLTRIFDVDDDSLPIISKEKAHPDTNTAPGYSIESNRDLESNEDF
jgi:replicative DNA helicase